MGQSQQEDTLVAVVYCWRNLDDNKRLVGSSTRGGRIRKREYLNALRKGTCHNQHFQNARDKYGPKRFLFEILEICEKEETLKRETYWISYYNSTETGYNFQRIAGHSNLGVKWPEKVIRKFREAAKRRMERPEERERMLAQSRNITPETRAKIGESRKGKGHTPEAIAKIAAAGRRPCSEESKRKKSEAQKGRPGNPKAIEAARQARLGTKASEETREKMSKSMKAYYKANGHWRTGSTISPEIKEKMSATHLLQWQDPETRRKQAEGIARRRKEIEEIKEAQLNILNIGAPGSRRIL